MIFLTVQGGRKQVGPVSHERWVRAVGGEEGGRAWRMVARRASGWAAKVE